MNHRKRARAPIDIYVNKYMSGVPYLARGEDISRGGLRLSHVAEPSRSTIAVGLQFQLPGSNEVIYAEGEVVREWTAEQSSRSRGGSGVRFTLLTERHQRLIDAYIAEHTEE